MPRTPFACCLPLLLLSLLAAPRSQALELYLHCPPPTGPADRVVGLTADLEALVHRADAAAHFHPESLRAVVAGAPDMDLPLSCVRLSSGEYTVLVERPANAGDIRVYFGDQGRQRRIPPRDLAVNLFPPGSLDLQTPADVLYPSILSSPAFKQGKLAFSGDRPRSTPQCLVLLPDEQTPTVLAALKWQELPPGTYEFSLALRVPQVPASMAGKSLASAAVVFYDAHRKLVGTQQVLAVLSQQLDDWSVFKKAVVVPSGARFVAIHIAAVAADVPVYVDDIRVIRPLQQRVDEAFAPDGRRVTLALSHERIRRLDAAATPAAAAAGFSPLTPQSLYSPQTGYGWENAAGVQLLDAGYPPAAHARELIVTRGGALRVDLPPGRYRVWLLHGSYPAGRLPWYFRGQRITLNARLVFEAHPSAHETFEQQWTAGYTHLWRPDIDLYQTFVQPMLHETVQDVEVSDAGLSIGLQHVPLRAVAIYPLALAEAQIDAELAHWNWLVRRAVNRRAFALQPRALDFELQPQEQASGLVLFQNAAETPVNLGTRPTPQQRLTSLHSVAARGQTQALDVSLHPLRDLHAVRLSVSELTSSSGATLPGDAVQVRFARYMPVITEDGYTLRPSVLDHRDSLDLYAGLPQRYWLQIRVPAQAPAELYRGSVRIESDSGSSLQLPLTLSVLPFELPPPRLSVGLYYTSSEWYTRFIKANVIGPSFDDDPQMDAITFDVLRAHLRFLRDIGYSGVALKDDLRFSFRFDGATAQFPDDHRFVRWMDAYRDAGFGPMPFFGFNAIGTSPNFIRDFCFTGYEHLSTPWQEAYVSIIRTLSQRAAQRNWPEILWYVSDELSNHGKAGGQLGVRLGQLTKDIPGTRTLASMNGQHEHAMAPHVDIAMPNFAFPINEQTLGMIRDSGAELWLFNVTDTRYSFGLYPWSVGARGRYQWDFGGAEPSERWGPAWSTLYGIHKRGPNGEMFANEIALQHQAGIDDYRYLQLLEDAIAQSDDAAAVQEARAFLQQLRQSVPVDIREVMDGSARADETGAEAGIDVLSWRDLDEVRWSIAQHVAKLRGLALPPRE